MPGLSVRPPRGATGLWQCCGARAGRGVAATRRHRRRAPADCPSFFRRTPVKSATGARKGGIREGRRVARVRACVPGLAEVRGEVGGPYGGDHSQVAAQPLYGLLSDRAKSLKNIGNAMSCGGPIEVGFDAMGHSNQGLQLCYLSIWQKNNFVYLEFSKYFSGTFEMLHGSLGS